MDFALPAEAERFRSDLREFISREWPKELQKQAHENSAEAYPEVKEFRRKLAERGWIAHSWPKEYGGRSGSVLEQYILQEEMSYYSAPYPKVGASMVAPTLMHFGNEEQKRQYLPQIASGEIDFCLGYSEPDAGSDLASLQIRAEEDGDFFVINGVKRWTSGAHRSEYCWLAARTDPAAPKHRGISLIIVPMDSPGLTVRPIWTMADHRTNETYWENVRVPRANLVGELNRGWYYVAAALDFERFSAFPTGEFRAVFDRLVRTVKETIRGGQPLKADPLIRQRIAQISIELEATQILGHRVAWLVSKGEIPNYEASMLKMYGTEAQQRMAHAATEILGLYGQLREGAPGAPLDGEIEREYRAVVMPTFGAGANELQRSIIATRGMGLPRA